MAITAEQVWKWSKWNFAFIYLIYLIYFGQGFPSVSQTLGHTNLVMVSDTTPSYDVLPHKAWRSLNIQHERYALDKITVT